MKIRRIKDENKKNLIDFKFLDNHYFINLFGLTIRIKSKLKQKLLWCSRQGKLIDTNELNELMSKLSGGN